jgi:hypothetical protein
MGELMTLPSLRHVSSNLILSSSPLISEDNFVDLIVYQDIYYNDYSVLKMN